MKCSTIHHVRLRKGMTGTDAQPQVTANRRHRQRATNGPTASEINDISSLNILISDRSEFSHIIAIIDIWGAGQLALGGLFCCRGSVSSSCRGLMSNCVCLSYLANPSASQREKDMESRVSAYNTCLFSVSTPCHVDALRTII